jgi:hypothetical protein
MDVEPTLPGYRSNAKVRRSRDPSGQRLSKSAISWRAARPAARRAAGGGMFLVPCHELIDKNRSDFRTLERPIATPGRVGQFTKEVERKSSICGAKG